MLDLETSEKCVKDSLSFEDIGGRSGVNQDPFSGALVLSNQQMNLRDYHFRMVWNGLYQGFRQDSILNRLTIDVDKVKATQLCQIDETKVCFVSI